MSYNTPIAVVQAWQDAANHQNRDLLIELSAPDIEIVGPRGSGYGHQLLLDWLNRAGLHLTTLQAFARDNTVVLAQHAIWRSLETGAITAERDLASRFLTQGQQVTQFARHDDLDTALNASGLTHSDEIQV